MKFGLKILTLNCWGLPFLTPQKNRRLDAITEIIRNGKWDVVALQEVWLKGDQKRLIENAGFPHHLVFPTPSRFMGSGLILLSKFKILESEMRPFLVRGLPHRIHEGDFHATKGIGYALLETPLGNVPFFVTHLIAKYSKRHEDDVNRVFRLAQILELIFYIRRKASPESFVLCGDLNAVEDDMEMQTLYALTGTSPVPANRLRTFRKRLDHIICGATNDTTNLRVASHSLVFRNSFSQEQIPYSDHEGVSAIVRRCGASPAHVNETRRVLQRTLRYMTHALVTLETASRWTRFVPLLNWAIAYFTTPQLRYVNALLRMLEADIRSAESTHPLRLKEIV